MIIEINHCELNRLLSTAFTMGIAKTVCIHDFQVKHKNLVLLIEKHRNMRMQINNAKN